MGCVIEKTLEAEGIQCGQRRNWLGVRREFSVDSGGIVWELGSRRVIPLRMQTNFLRAQKDFSP